jgi:hypothetical protein
MHCGWRLGAVAGRPPHARGVLQPHRRAGGARQRTPGVLRGAAGGGVEARVRHRKVWGPPPAAGGPAHPHGKVREGVRLHRVRASQQVPHQRQGEHCRQASGSHPNDNVLYSKMSNPVKHLHARN